MLAHGFIPLIPSELVRTCDEASPFWRCDGGTGSGRPAIRLAAAGDDGDEVSGDEGRCGGSAAGTESPANEADEDSCPRAAERIGGDGAVPKVGVGSGALVPAFPDALSNSAISSRSACNHRANKNRN